MAVTLSIILPVYQCEKYISECLSSVLNQLPEDYELILVDDGSTDSTPAVLASYENTSHNLRIIYREHHGTSPARNAGLAAAKGKYTAFLDCDDMLRENFLSESRNLLSLDADMYIFGIERITQGWQSELWTVNNRNFDTASDFADEYIRLLSSC